MTWWQAYIGQAYIPGENDCAALAVRVQAEVFGREIDLPTERATSVRGMSRQIEAHKNDFATRTDNPDDGDAVLMIGRGRLDHIGVFVMINGEGYVLHAMRDAGQVCLHRLRDLHRYGLDIEGFYQWN